MKSTLRTLILTFATTLTFTTAAHAIIRGNEGANGGDDVGLQFQQAFASVLAEIKIKLPDLDKKIQDAQLAKILAGVQVLVVDQDLNVSAGNLTQDSVASNNAATGQILINRARWQALTNPVMKEAIALHEVASLAGLESTGVYSLSQEYLSLYHLSLDPQYDFTCDSRIKIAHQLTALTLASYQSAAAEFTEYLDAAAAEVKTQFTCHTVTVSQYCQAATPIAQNYVDYANFQLEAGAGSRLDVLQAEMKKAEILSVCQP